MISKYIVLFFKKKKSNFTRFLEFSIESETKQEIVMSEKPKRTITVKPLMSGELSV